MGYVINRITVNPFYVEIGNINEDDKNIFFERSLDKLTNFFLLDKVATSENIKLDYLGTYLLTAPVRHIYDIWLELDDLQQEQKRLKEIREESSFGIPKTNEVVINFFKEILIQNLAEDPNLEFYEKEQLKTICKEHHYRGWGINLNKLRFEVPESNFLCLSIPTDNQVPIPTKGSTPTEDQKTFTIAVNVSHIMDIRMRARLEAYKSSDNSSQEECGVKHLQCSERLALRTSAGFALLHDIFQHTYPPAIRGELTLKVVGKESGFGVATIWRDDNNHQMVIPWSTINWHTFLEIDIFRSIWNHAEQKIQIIRASPSPFWTDKGRCCINKTQHEQKPYPLF